AAGVAATPHLNIGQQFSHPHFQERGLYTNVEHPLAGATTVYGIPWKLSDTPGAIRTAAPILGQHTEHILKDIVGLSDGEIASLTREGVLS
ncbi:MAG: CoA transferase, partial [Chloroflexota bacterium]